MQLAEGTKSAPKAVPNDRACMNAKAKQYLDFLGTNKITCFTAAMPSDRPNTVIFRSFLTVEGENLPMWVEIDDTVFVMVYVRLCTKPVSQKKRSELLDYFNEMNSRFKVFKYTINKAGEFLLVSCLPAPDDAFSPQMVNGVLDLILKHVEDTYASLMRIVWSD